MAIVLHWLAQASMYAIGKSTVAAIVHDGIAILRDKVVPEVIHFPTGPELLQVVVDLEALCGFPCCAGALDGTCVPMKSHQSLRTHTSAIRSSLPLLC